MDSQAEHQVENEKETHSSRRIGENELRLRLSSLSSMNGQSATREKTDENDANSQSSDGKVVSLYSP
jgi:hypothetical protein